MLMYRTDHTVSLSSTNLITYKRTARGSKRRYYHKCYAGNIPYDICYRKRTFAQMLHIKKEDKPCGKRYEILNHGPQRHIKNSFEFISVE